MWQQWKVATRIFENSISLVAIEIWQIFAIKKTSLELLDLVVWICFVQTGL
jgi:hypothetical protein